MLLAVLILLSGLFWDVVLGVAPSAVGADAELMGDIPAITLDTPAHDETVEKGIVRVSGTYQGLYDIKLFINGTRQVDAQMTSVDGTDAGMWHYDLDTSMYSGTVHLRARGLDVNTRYGIWSASTYVHVDRPSAAPPIVTIDSPSEGVSLSGDVEIRVTVQSAAPIERVEVRINGGAWQTASALPDGDTYVLLWDTSGIGDQTSSIEARAYTKDGVKGASLTTYAKVGEGTNETVVVPYQDRAMWIWEGASYNMLLNPGSRQVLLEMAQDTDTFDSDPVTVLYFAVGPFAGMDVMEDEPELLRDFITWAHAHGMQVHACIAGGTSPPYMGAYREFHDVAIRHFEQVLNYNISSEPEARFDGVNVDIEPYISPDFGDLFPSLQIQYLELTERMIERRDATGLNLPFGPAIPRWYDSSDRAKDIPFNGETKWLSEHIQDMVDYISIMNYRDTADGSAGLIAQVEGEMAYANRIGKPRSVVLGVETLDIANSGDPETITFREEGRAHMEAELDKVYAAFGDNPAFGGIAMHHYDSIRWLPSHWGPDGVFWLPSADHEAPTAVTRQPSAQAVDYQTVTVTYGRAYDNQEVEKYVIYRSTEPGFAASAANAVGTSRTLSYKDVGLLPETTYYYKVAAVDIHGNIGPVSEQASATTGTTALRPMIISAMKTTWSGGQAVASVQVADWQTGALLSAHVEGRFTFAGGRYVSGNTAGAEVAFTSEGIPEGYQVGFWPRRIVAEGYYWAQAYDTPRVANARPQVRLHDLEMSSGVLSSPFTADTAHYSVIVAEDTTSIRVTPTAERATTSIKVNGVYVASGAISSAIPLHVGDNVIVVETAAPDASLSSYTITVRRPAPADNVIKAAEDAYVHQNEPSVNFGSEPYLNVLDITNADGGGDHLTYMKFDISEYTLPIQSVTMNVYSAYDLSKTVKIDVIGYPDDSWKESTLTFNNRPLAGPVPIGTISVQQSGWYSIDITEFVQTQAGPGHDNKVTLRLIINDIPGSSGELVQFHSREHEKNAPYLLINPSADATLAHLTLSSGRMEPRFAPDQLQYHATVTGSVYGGITVTPTVSHRYANVKVNGIPVDSGTSSGEIPLALGANAPIDVEVTAQDGTTAIYTIDVTKHLSESSKSLADLTLTGAVLDAPFQAERSEYRAEVQHDVSEVVVHARAYDPHALVRANGVGGTREILATIPLNVGDNGIRVEVIVQDDVVKTYDVLVHRAAAEQDDDHATPPGGSDGDGDGHEQDDVTPNVDSANEVLDIHPVVESDQVSIRVNGERTTADGTSMQTVRIVPEWMEEVLRAVKDSEIFRLVVVIDNGADDVPDQLAIDIDPQVVQQLAEKGWELVLSNETWAIELPLETLLARSMSGAPSSGNDVDPLRFDIGKYDPSDAQNDRVVRQWAAFPALQRALGDRGFTPVAAPLAIASDLRGERVVLRLLVPEGLLHDDEELAVYVEHEDGENALYRGRIGTDDDGKSTWIEIEIDKFSLFTIVRLNNQPVGYIAGYSDGTLRPEHTLTRAEAAVMLKRLGERWTTVEDEGEIAQVHSTQENTVDPWTDHWAVSALTLMRGIGVLEGDLDGRMRPDAAVTRAELSIMLSRWMGLVMDVDAHGSPFADTAGHWAEASIAAGKALGWWNGYADGTFRPDQTVTRAEAVAVINRVIGREATPGADNGAAGESPWIDVPSQHWALDDLRAAAAYHAQ